MVKKINDIYSFQEAFLMYLLKVFEVRDIFTFEEIKYMFLLAINDYLNKKININAFSSIATQLYYTLKKPSSFNINNDITITGDMLDTASELEWDIQNRTSTEYTNSINLLKNYYKENKKFI